MSRSERAAATPRADRRYLVPSVSALLGVLLLLPAAGRASCQAPSCRHQHNLYFREMEKSERERLANDPADMSLWQDLMQTLSSKPAREREIARYEAHVDWEPQPALEIDLETRLLAERAAWLVDWKQAFPDRGEPWCFEAGLESTLQARIERLRIAADMRPASLEVHLCLAHALREAGSARDGVAVLQSFRDRNPSAPGIHSAIAYMLQGVGGSPDEVRAAFEEHARSTPDDRGARKELLRYYDQEGLDAERDRLLADLEASGDLQERHSVCLALSGRSEASRRAMSGCRTRLLADFAEAELSEDDRAALLRDRDSLLTTAKNEGDWAAVRRLLADWPADSLGRAWESVAREMKDGCAALRETWRHGALRSALVGPHAAGQAASLGHAFRECGDVALRDEVERPHIADASDEDLRWMESDAARAEWRRRTALDPADAERWRDLADETAGKPLAEQLPNLLGWNAAAPDDPVPARRLSAEYEKAGNGEEAVRWLLEAASRTPQGSEDVVLQAAALALRFRLHEPAAATARKVLAAPASPRQHAEAHYLLGRVALREGRREEAAGELLRYFPLRLRYAGACGASPDRGLLALLLANYDLPRLRVYLDERATAIEWYRAHLHNPPPEAEGSTLTPAIARIRHYEPLRCLADPLPPPVEAPVLAACVPVATNEYLSRGGADAAPAGERKRRLLEATAATPCPAGWPGDLEPLFEDERLLSPLG